MPAARRFIEAQWQDCAKGTALQVGTRTHTEPAGRRIALPTELVNVVATLPGKGYRFTLSPEGRLTTQEGDPVMGEGGEIVIDPAKGQVAIAQDGTVSQADEKIGKVAVFLFDDRSVLDKDRGNLFKNTSNAEPVPDTASRVRQGMLEGSNVNPILQITRMIEVSRAYESVVKTMENTADLSRRAVERLGRVA